MKSCSKTCEPCLSGEKGSVAALKFCQECEESYCESCSLIHKAQKATRNHDLVDIEDIQLQFPKSAICEPCSYNGNTAQASFRCIECEESYCDACAQTHKSQKATRSHQIVPFGDEARNTCEACDYNGIRDKPAAGKCTECDEVLCENCVKVHKSQKATRQHKIQETKASASPDVEKHVYEDNLSFREKDKCGVCKKILLLSTGNVCLTCLVILCPVCCDNHRRGPLTSNHKMIQLQEKNIDDVQKKLHDTETASDSLNEETPVFENAGIQQTSKGCEKCQLSNSVGGFCAECRLQLCKLCTVDHQLSLNTNQHTILVQTKTVNDKDKELENSNLENEAEEQPSNCGRCHVTKKVEIEGFCVDCKIPLCSVCVIEHSQAEDSQTHSVLVQTKPEKPLDLQDDAKSNPSDTIMTQSDVTDAQTNEDWCMLCKGKESSVVAFCLTCKLCLCNMCVQVHETGGEKDVHKIMYTANPTGREVSTSEKNKENECINKTKPGRPVQVGALKADRITVTWSAPEICLDSFTFQLRYRRKDITQWEYYEEKTAHNTAIIKDLKSHSAYVVQVRMVNNETEGPYSEESDEIDTLPSAAELLLPNTVKDLEYDGPLSVHKIILTENDAARNPSLKTRKLAIGNGVQHAVKEKIILLLGASGTGKSTFVNGIVNFIFGVSFADPFRFTLVDLESDEKANTEDRGKTRWITCYTINPSKGSNIDFPVTLVDTPGFGDKGIEEDESIKKQLRELFSAVNEKGILFVDAVCIFIKASEARLTVTQQYIYTTIISLFHRDIKENICLIITFSDGKSPPVLSLLRAADLPSDWYYTFNTADMFSDNTQSVTKMFYELNCKSFESFTIKVKSLKSKSLSQSNDVLAKREEVQKRAESLLVKVDKGLEKMENCKKEIAVLEQFKAEMIANKNFKYKTKKKVQVLVPLEKGKHTTNCLHCHVTCHRDCTRANDEDKAKCIVMDPKGYCKVCEDNCYWKEHKNTAYIFEWNEVEEICIYEELKSKYEKAKGEVGSHEAIVSQMNNELDDIETEMLDTMNKIAECNNELSSMALRANPLSVSEHIDIIIENEKWARKPGFVDRINNLERLKRRTAIRQEFEQFKKSMEETR